MIRPARPDEASVVRQLVQDAYGHYAACMGKLPGPMLDDYAQRIVEGQAWVLEESGELAGVLVTENLVLCGRLGFRETGRVSGRGYERVHMAKMLA